jgi:hypothetical protein
MRLRAMTAVLAVTCPRSLYQSYCEFQGDWNRRHRGFFLLVSPLLVSRGGLAGSCMRPDTPAPRCEFFRGDSPASY